MSRLILVLLFIVIFYIIFIAYSDFNNFTLNIFQFQIEYLIPVIGLYLSGIFISGIRQQSLFKTIGITIPIKKSILLFMAGLSMEVTPAGSGKLIKSYYLKKKFGYGISKSFPVFIIERFYDLLALTTIILLTLFFVQFIEVAIIVSLVISLLLIIYITINSKSFFKFAVKLLEKIPFVKKFILPIEESQEIFKILTSKNTLIKNWGLSTFAFSNYALAIFFIFIGFKINYDIIFTTFITFSSLLFGALSLIPAGVGVTEVSLVGFLINEGVNLSLATSIMIMIRLTSIWFFTLVGFITTKLFLK